MPLSLPARLSCTVQLASDIQGNSRFAPGIYFCEKRNEPPSPFTVNDFYIQISNQENSRRYTVSLRLRCHKRAEMIWKTNRHT